VCGKKVGAWHKSGIHPKCRERTFTKAEDAAAGVDAATTSEAIHALSQAQRDRILRRMNAKVK
jgi:hypothetical protein